MTARSPRANARADSSSRAGHREVAAQQSARRAWGERRRRRRPRLEAGSFTFTSAYGQSDYFPHRIGSRAAAGAFGKAGRTRQSWDLAGKQGLSIVRQVSSLSVWRARETSIFSSGRAGPATKGRRRHSSVRAPNSCRSKAAITFRVPASASPPRRLRKKRRALE